MTSHIYILPVIVIILVEKLTLIWFCISRIGIGSFEGRSVYRAAEVADVVETAKVYAVGKARTNIGLK